MTVSHTSVSPPRGREWRRIGRTYWANARVFIPAAITLAFAFEELAQPAARMIYPSIEQFELIAALTIIGFLLIWPLFASFHRPLYVDESLSLVRIRGRELHIDEIDRLWRETSGLYTTVFRIGRDGGPTARLFIRGSPLLGLRSEQIAVLIEVIRASRIAVDPVLPWNLTAAQVDFLQRTTDQISAPQLSKAEALSDLGAESSVDTAILKDFPSGTQADVPKAPPWPRMFGQQTTALRERDLLAEDAASANAVPPPRAARVARAVRAAAGWGMWVAGALFLVVVIAAAIIEGVEGHISNDTTDVIGPLGIVIAGLLCFPIYHLARLVERSSWQRTAWAWLVAHDGGRRSRGLPLALARHFGMPHPEVALVRVIVWVSGLVAIFGLVAGPVLLVVGDDPAPLPGGAVLFATGLLASAVAVLVYGWTHGLERRLQLRQLRLLGAHA